MCKAQSQCDQSQRQDDWEHDYDGGCP